MAQQHGFSVIDNCLTCPVRHDRLFCDIPEAAVRHLDAIKGTAFYPKGAFLCLEGQMPRGIFILCNGRAKITASGADGKTIILGIAAPGEVLGLSAVLSSKPYEMTVETLEATQANFIGRNEFLEFMRKYPDVGMRVAQQLTHTCQAAFEEIRSLGLSHSVPERFARLVLQWAETPSFARKDKTGETIMKVVSTQEEIAQMIGTSRETVSRIIADFKKKGLLRVKGATWTIPNLATIRKQAAV
jgi:CRP/FNR family transcriptional regulator